MKEEWTENGRRIDLGWLTAWWAEVEYECSQSILRMNIEDGQRMDYTDKWGMDG
jgi:hypothetical protein